MKPVNCDRFFCVKKMDLLKTANFVVFYPLEIKK